MKWNHERSLSFAGPGLPVDEDSPETASSCPDRSLAVTMAAAWVGALDLEKWCVAEETPLERVPLQFSSFELVRKGTEGGSCSSAKLAGSNSNAGTSRNGFNTILSAATLVGSFVLLILQ